MRCANVVSPSGGPKDKIPPVVLSAIPENQSTNFQGKDIHITFDEYVTLNNPNSNIMISPPLENNPNYKLSGKSLIIKFKELWYRRYHASTEYILAKTKVLSLITSASKTI